MLDLYACVRPVKYYQGVPSPVKHPEKLDIVIYRENTETCTRASSSRKAGGRRRLIDFLNNDLLKSGKKNVRADSGVGISRFPSSAASGWCAMPFAPLSSGPQDVTLVHKGNIRNSPRAHSASGLRGRTAGVPRRDRHRARELDSGQ